MTTNDLQPAARRGTRGSRSGYVVATLVNAALLYIANNLLAWDVLPFLTDQFTRVLPLVNLSLATTIAVNGVPATVARAVLVLVLVGVAIAVVVDVTKLRAALAAR